MCDSIVLKVQDKDKNTQENAVYTLFLLPQVDTTHWSYTGPASQIL